MAPTGRKTERTEFRYRAKSEDFMGAIGGDPRSQSFGVGAPDQQRRNISRKQRATHVAWSTKRSAKQNDHLIFGWLDGNLVSYLEHDGVVSQFNRHKPRHGDMPPCAPSDESPGATFLTMVRRISLGVDPFHTLPGLTPSATRCPGNAHHDEVSLAVVNRHDAHSRD